MNLGSAKVLVADCAAKAPLSTIEPTTLNNLLLKLELYPFSERILLKMTTDFSGPQQFVLKKLLFEKTEFMNLITFVLGLEES